MFSLDLRGCGCDIAGATISGFESNDVETEMANQTPDTQDEREVTPPPSSTGAPPPVVVQNTQDGGGSSGGMGVVAIVALVAIVLVGIWWFGFGPGTGGGTTDTPDTAPPSSAPVQSVPPASSL
jgi:hypothetical protein